MINPKGIPHLFLALLGLLECTYAYLHHDAACLDACSEGLDYVTFGDVPPNIDYYVKKCTDDLMLQSTYLCARYYCTEREIQAGIEYLDDEVCKLYGHIALKPLSIVNHVTNEELHKITRASISDIRDGTVFNSTVIPDRKFFDRAYKTVDDFGFELSIHELYGWAMYIFWASVVFISLLTKFFDFMHRRRARSFIADTEQNSSTPMGSSLSRACSTTITYLSTAPTIGTRVIEPYFWCTVPPLVQSLTILAFIIINFVLCCVSYRAFNGNLYWSSKTIQLWRYISDRTGIVCFANLPLVWVFGSRNNVLIWVTGWSFSTFNSFHRWVARIATLEAVIHSIGWTVEYFLTGQEAGVGGQYFYDEWKAQYFQCGVIATVTMCLMLGFSFYGLRQRAYQVFLITHIGLALITLITLFYHVAILEGQYTGYLWAVTAVWCFDRFARLLRIAMLNGKIFTGSQSATAWYSSNSETIYLDVPTSVDIKLGPGTSYYIYLLHGWKFWESHPFTAVSILRNSSNVSNDVSNSNSHIEDESPEKLHERKNSTGGDTTSTLSLQDHQIRFAIRPFAGFTARFRNILAHTTPNERKSVRVLLEGPYGHAASVKSFDNNVFIVGGSGITAALSHLQSNIFSNSTRHPSLRLHWSVRHIAAFEEFRDELAAYSRNLDAKITVYVTREPKNEVEKIKIRENVYPSGWSVEYGRMHVPTVLLEESDIGATAVVGCGPARMMDETRNAALHLVMEKRKHVQYYQETFGW